MWLFGKKGKQQEPQQAVPPVPQQVPLQVPQEQQQQQYAQCCHHAVALNPQNPQAFSPLPPPAPTPAIMPANHSFAPSAFRSTRQKLRYPLLEGIYVKKLAGITPPSHLNLITEPLPPPMKVDLGVLEELAIISAHEEDKRRESSGREIGVQQMPPPQLESNAPLFDFTDDSPSCPPSFFLGHGGPAPPPPPPYDAAVPSRPTDSRLSVVFLLSLMLTVLSVGCEQAAGNGT
mmetsp:Transcript_30084/g.79458  ORF Transcript_30084/g.79458 Transcript_30084/m.79458 type:complete len:232 (+) Transcript_30084:77-772(+)